MPCNITGIARLPSGAVLANTKIVFKKLSGVGSLVDGAETPVVFPVDEPVYTDATGAVDFDLYYGSYRGTAYPSGSAPEDFAFGVPETATAVFGACVDLVPEIPTDIVSGGAITAAAEASASATDAATSAASASSFASASSTSATAASTAQTAAETAQTGAETAQTAAEAARDTASTAATTATTKASEASTSATNASGYATSAQTAQTAAEAAQTGAETAQTAAEAAALTADVHKDTFAAAVAATDIIVGQVIAIEAGANGAREYADVVAAGTYASPDGVLVRDATGISAQIVSKRREFLTDAEFNADQRPQPADGVPWSVYETGAEGTYQASGFNRTLSSGLTVYVTTGQKRDLPDATFSFAGIVPTICESTGTAQASETVSEYAKRVHSALIGSGAIWVDPLNGSDANSGTELAPVKTLSYAVRSLAPSQIYCLPGTYSKFDFRTTDTPGAKLKILTALGPCYIREPADDLTSATFTADATYPSCWYAPLTSANPDPVALLDTSTTDFYGQPRSLAEYASLAELNSFANGSGYWYDSTNDRIYIRYGRTGVDMNTLKSRFDLVTSNSASRLLIYGTKILMHGDWRMMGVFPEPLVYSTTIPYFYMDCHTSPGSARAPNLAYSWTHGLDSLGAYSYISGVWAHRNKGDNLHYTDSAGYGCNGVEINCLSTYAGDIDGTPTAANTSNGSAIHGTSNIIRINGRYERNYGPNVVDSGTGKSWCVGSYAGPGGNSGNDQGIYANGVEMWVDTCTASGNQTADFATYTPSVLHKYRCSYRTTDTSGGGSIEEYVPA